MNDWSEWEQSMDRRTQLQNTGKDPNEFISGAACDSWNLFKEDLRCLKELGVNSYRFSIEWSRVEPARGSFDQNVIDRYVQFAKRLTEEGIEPFVTLWHWPVPLWVRDQGRFESTKTIDDFVTFVEVMVEAMRPYVRTWITINEPLVYASNSYLTGQWPPQKKHLRSTIRVARHLIEAHRRAYEAIKQIDSTLQVGLSKHNIHFSAKQPWGINQLIARTSTYVWNEWFLNRVRHHQDFIGLNYYFHNSVDLKLGKQKKIVSDIGWELYPEGLYRVLKGLKRYGKPVYITEHGLADKDDRHRAWYLQESLRYAARALNEGVDLRGYFHWSLLDNFEWADGFFPRFGLFEVDFKTCKRKARPSVDVYRRIIEQGGPLKEDEHHMNPLVSTASTNLTNILTHAIEFSAPSKALVIFDDEAPLTEILTEAYRQALKGQDFVNIKETGAENILERINQLSPGDLVVLVQSMNFRLNEFRVRIELFNRELKTVEHVHLARMHEDQFPRYIDALAYDPNYYRLRGRALKEKIDRCNKIIVECPGTTLVYDSPFEETRLNIGDYSEMKNTGGTFPIGEVFSEPKDLDKVNGELKIFAFAGKDHIMREYEPFTVVINGGILSAPEAPEEFQEILHMIEERSPVHVREFGLGLNPAMGKGKLINDVTGFERMLGLHLSLGSKHSIYKKPGLPRKSAGFHVDVFADLERIVIDDEVVFENGDYTGLIPNAMRLA